MHYAILATFVLGYLGIAFEHNLRIDKASIALLTGGICWTLLVFSGQTGQEQYVDGINNALSEHLAQISSILFFLLGAMTIVELIDANHGFELVIKGITTRNKVKLLWVMAILTFVLSAVLDNLTTSIIMATVLKKLISDRRELFTFGGIMVIAANAGGAWSPIGDVTTIMLWAGGQLSALNIMKEIFLPSVVCLLIPLIWLSFKFKGELADAKEHSSAEKHVSRREQMTVLVGGLTGLIFVLFFKVFTHLPPYLGMLISLGTLWIGSEILKRNRERKEKEAVTMIAILKKLDLPTLFFFLGILLAVGALETSGQLHQLATFLGDHFSSIVSINYIIGVLSSVVDNVPLVAGAIGMYPFEVYSMDHPFWELLAYCAGTGGSILIIGSAAGVAIMGLLKLDFAWYFRRISFMAFLGYTGGVITYYLINIL